MEAFIEKFGEYGVLGLIVIIGIVGIWKIGSFLGKKLFDDEKGLCTRAINSHIELVSKLGENQDKQTEILTGMQEETKKQNDRLSKIEEIQSKAVIILDKLACSKNGKL